MDISCTKLQKEEICNNEICSINSYKKGAIICAFCAVIFLLLAYFITVFKPELRVGEKGEILSFLEPYFWIESRLWPFLTISLLNAVCCVFLYGKFLKDKEEKRRVGFRYHIWADIFNRVKYSFLSDDIKPVEYLSSAKINYELQHCGRRNDTGGF